MTTRRITEGASEPLGVTPDATGANVAVFSAHAEAIELCLFDDAGEAEIERVRLPFRSGDVFHAHIEGLRVGQRYGFRARGAFDPQDGHRFNPAKLLVDPYALALDRPFALHPSMFAYGPHERDDSAPQTPKAIVARPQRAAAARPNIPWRETVIYELHVRGFTRRHPDIPENLRGTFTGLAQWASIAHLKMLGVTTIEVMPCAAWVDERHLAPLGLTNYWGYNPIAMMAPDPRLAPGGWDEVRESVATLHAAGFEVIVDVVFNHTGEGDELGPMLSLRGLDNASFYRLRPEDHSAYVNDAGCGNILAFDRACVTRYAMDALRAWADYGGVDGFRFDLATTLARRPEGFDRDAPFLAAIAQDPVLRNLKLIAEPWDIGPGGYQLGNFPQGFGEWNDRFRDCVRRFWRGDDVGVAELATRVAGSSDFFARRRPSRSVNFVTAHDGFTLRDLVSYERKHNEANGEDNRDGTSDNASWNNGAEGESDDAQVKAARARDQRNLLATLLLARGAPMLSMGAEMGQTQGGDNNAYAQDNGVSWLDWNKADASLAAFTAKLLALRKSNPALTDDRFLDGATRDATLIPDVEWLRPDGATMREEDWRDARAATLIVSLYAQDNRVVIIWRRGHDALAVTPPAPRDGFAWRVALDTARDDAANWIENETVSIAARSVVLLVEERRAAPARAPSTVTPELLSRLAEATGVATQWHDVDGASHDVPRDTLIMLLAGLGYPAHTLSEARDSLARLAAIEDRRALPQSLVCRGDDRATLRLPAIDGRTPSRLVVTLEDGSERRIAFAANDLEPLRWRGVDGRNNQGVLARLPALARGRHVLRLDASDVSCRLTIAPARCHPPQATRAFGFAAQLYSLRREGDQGVGDYSTLTQLATLGAAEGAALIALNPLHALFTQDRERASPYYPSDRRFLDPLYIDLLALGDMLPPISLDDEEAAIAAIAGASAVDYPRAHALKMRVLERAFAAFDDLAQRRPDVAPGADFARFVERGGAALRRFACFETISETRRGEDWRRWPVELREAREDALRSLAQEHAPRLRFHQFLQWLGDRQFGAAADAAREAGLTQGFCRDLAVGAAPDGAESWSKADRLVDGFAIGAPPDSFSRDGQVWGLPPPNPLAVKADGGADFAELVGVNMRHAGALRIDHVMGLARLFVVPDGAKASEGAYLSYPLDAALGQLALESERARCMVVGEDLGTLPWGFREELDGADVLSYRVVWFEREGASFAPPAHYAQKAMACVSTHDLPTLEGWWANADIDEKRALGLISPETAAAEAATRCDDKRALLAALRREGLIDGGVNEMSAFDDALAQALHAFAARGPSLLAMAQIDDLAGERSAVNLPGTDRERPNWRRKIAPYLTNLFVTSRARSAIAGLRRNLG